MPKVDLIPFEDCDLLANADRLGPRIIKAGNRTLFSSKEVKSIKEVNVLFPEDKGLGASFTHEDRIRPTNPTPRRNRVCNLQITNFTHDKKKLTNSEINFHGTSILDRDKETFRSEESQWLNKFDKYEKKGLLLIINFMFSGEEERTGSDEDVGNLCTFFTKLKYDIDCRVDMTTEELRTCLEDVRHNYLSRNSSKYHCFICVIMSHGSKKGIETTDGFIEIDEIVDYFKNDKMKKFVGKPKMFIFQACRGEDIKQIQNNQASHRMVQHDSGSRLVKLPKEADILKIYATTPGNLCYRTTGSKSWNGSWLIHAFLDMAKKMHSKHHIDEIMTAVKHQLSTNPEYVKDGETCQMALSENSLTKLFYL
ncbi:caspase-3-like [Mytilus californianus]|uniref:caspase-3-like n=1 Tax=Mytilus californianus TaxID=6549 RepID=UPI00224788A6|nr:caspase-3-like [Mytilus californianus]